jgi:hypothetical protein
MAPGIPTDDWTPVQLSLPQYRKIFSRPTWHSLGACHNRPTEWFFSTKSAEILAATVVCNTLCPVRWRCLADNLDVPLGIFGGLNAEQRKTIRDDYPVVVAPELLQLLMEKKDTG